MKINKNFNKNVLIRKYIVSCVSHNEFIKIIYLCGHVGSKSSFISCNGCRILQENTIMEEEFLLMTTLKVKLIESSSVFILVSHVRKHRPKKPSCIKIL